LSFALERRSGAFGKPSTDRAVASRQDKERARCRESSPHQN
jgi:hypothetical protein